LSAQQPNLINVGRSPDGAPPAAVAKRGRGATPRRSSEDPGALCFVSGQPNLTGDKVMRYAFRPLKYWPDNGDLGLKIAFYFFQRLGCLTVASDRVLHGIYKCLEQYRGRELCEAIDAKAASLGETFKQRCDKVTYVPQPENFFDPDSALLKKWLAKSPTLQKRRSDEARAAAKNVGQSPAAADREQRARIVSERAEAVRDRRLLESAAAARKSAAWHAWVWPMLSPDEQNAAIHRAAASVEEDRKRFDLTPRECEEFLRERRNALASGAVLRNMPARFDDLRRQFEAEYGRQQAAGNREQAAASPGHAPGSSVPCSLNSVPSAPAEATP